MLIIKKRCTRCSRYKGIIDFSKNSSSKDGFRSICRVCQSDYYASNRDRILTQKREYDSVNKDKKAEYQKKYRSTEAYKEAHRENKKRYRLKNKPKINEYDRIRRSSDIQVRIAHNLRSRLSQAIRAEQKTGSAVDDLGCSIIELKSYLEELFEDGMSWSNYGIWQIDHIRPLASFDLSDRSQLLTACNYTNLQPLWAIENQKKGSRY